MTSGSPSIVRAISQPFWVLLAFGFGGLLLLAGLLTIAQDRDTIARSERLFETVLETRTNRVASLLLEYGYWDEAVEHIVYAFNPEWIANDFDPSYLQFTLGMDEVFVVDGANATVFCIVEGELVDEPSDIHSGNGIAALIAGARTAEDGATPVPSIGIVAVGNDLFLAAAVRMTTYGLVNGEEVNTSTDHVMVFAEKIDETFLETVETGFLLPGLRRSDQPGNMAQAFHAIRSADGMTAGYFVWNPRLTSLDHLPYLAAGILVAFVVMLLTARNFVRRVSAAADELEATRASAQAANTAKTEFLRTMTHEVRTPINAIVGFASMMKDETYGPIDNPRYKEYVGDITEAGGYVLDLVGDLLDLEKIEAGRMEYDRSAVDVGGVLAEAAGLFRSAAGHKNVSLDIEAPTAVVIESDGRVLRQMLLNMLSNAVKFTPAGGAVTCRADRIGDDRIAIEVRDTGRGMRPEDVARVQEPFGQMRESIGDTARGTGLGLPITKRLAEDMGGAFRLESAVDSGTVAVIELPIGNPPKALTNDTQAPPAAGAA